MSPGVNPGFPGVRGCGRGRVRGVPAGLYRWSSRGGRGRDPAGRAPLYPWAPPWLTPSVISTDRCNPSVISITLRCETGGSDRWCQTWQVAPLVRGRLSMGLLAAQRLLQV
jgi:hypothetical protein